MPTPVVLAALGVLVVSLDAAVNIALPAMAQAFGVGAGDIRWVIICYVVTYALTAFAAGVLADRVGAARVFTAGLALSALAFAAYAVAPGFAAVLALRVAQGVGGGLVYGTAPALVTQSLARERHGRGLGWMSAGLGLGLAVAPVVGGLLVDALGWPAAFVFRAPIALAVAVAAAVALRARSSAGAPARLHAGRDILRLSVLTPLVLAFLANWAQFSVWLLIPFYLVSLRGLTPTAGGLLFTLTPLGTAAAAPVAGWAADRLGSAWPSRLGLAVEVAGLAVLAGLTAGSSVGAVMIGLALVGLGVGVFQVANLSDLMAAFPRARQGAAGGLAFLGRTLGSAVGVQVTAAVFEARLADGFVPAFRAAFVAATAAAALGAVIALVRRPDARHAPPAAL
jgi:MFS family permease